MAFVQVQLINETEDLFSFSVIGAIVTSGSSSEDSNCLCFNVPAKQTKHFTFQKLMQSTALITQLHIKEPLYFPPELFVLPNKHDLMLHLCYVVTYPRDDIIIKITKKLAIEGETHELLWKENSRFIFSFRYSPLENIFSKPHTKLLSDIESFCAEKSIHLAQLLKLGSIRNNEIKQVYSTINGLIETGYCVCDGKLGRLFCVELHDKKFARQFSRAILIVNDAYLERDEFKNVEHAIEEILVYETCILIVVPHEIQESLMPQFMRIHNFQTKFKGKGFTVIVKPEPLINFLHLCLVLNLTPQKEECLYSNPGPSSLATFTPKASIFYLPEEKNAAKILAQLLRDSGNWEVPIIKVTAMQLHKNFNLPKKNVWIFARIIGGSRVVPDNMAKMLEKHANDVNMVLFYWMKHEDPVDEFTVSSLYKSQDQKQLVYAQSVRDWEVDQREMSEHVKTVLPFRAYYRNECVTDDLKKFFEEAFGSEENHTIGWAQSFWSKIYS